MLGAVPLLIIPFILYNLGLLGLTGIADADPWAVSVFSARLISGGTFDFTWGTLLVAVALVLLFVEILKATRTSNASVVDHLLSIFVFIAFLLEFVLVPGAAHPIFFTLMMISLVDVLAGFAVSLRSAGRDVTYS